MERETDDRGSGEGSKDRETPPFDPDPRLVRYLEGGDPEKAKRGFAEFIARRNAEEEAKVKQR
jgi:hypothetical protein